jgi:hypothetical protein
LGGARSACQAIAPAARRAASAVGVSGDRVRLAQRGDAVGIESEFGKYLVGVLPIARNLPLHAPGRAREPGGRRWLRDATHLDERTACHVVWVAGRLRQGQHRRDAGIGPFEDRSPLVAGLGRDELGEPPLLFRPGVLVVLWEVRLIDPEPLAQFGIELGLDGPDGQELAVGTPLGVVVRSAAVEHVGPAVGGPSPHGQQPVQEGRERRGAVNHCYVDDLALPGLVPFQ